MLPISVILLKKEPLYKYFSVEILSDMLINKLRVASYRLIPLRVEFIARVASYELFLLHELRATFCIRVPSYCSLHELRVTSYCLLQELRVTVYCTIYLLLFAYELRVTV